MQINDIIKMILRHLLTFCTFIYIISLSNYLMYYNIYNTLDNTIKKTKPNIAIKIDKHMYFIKFKLILSKHFLFIGIKKSDTIINEIMYANIKFIESGAYLIKNIIDTNQIAYPKKTCYKII